MLATRALGQALAQATDEADVASLATRRVATLLEVPSASLWRTVGDGPETGDGSATVRRAASVGDRLGRHLPEEVATHVLLGQRTRPPSLGVAIGAGEGALFGVLSVLRPRRPFTRTEGYLLTALADVTATAFGHVRALEQEATSERTHADQRLRSTYEAIACGVTVWSPEGALLQYNQAAEEIMGVPLGPQVGQPLMQTVRVVRDDGREAPAKERRVLTVARTGQAIRNYDSLITRADGQQRFLQMNAVPVFDADGTLDRVVCSFVDITERKQAEDLLAHQAHHDALTGLPNRTLLLDRLDQALAQARRSGQPVALLLIDLDGFKAVNDTRGHQIGDQLLAAVGARWSAGLRAGDTLARLGGDEFAVLLNETSRALAEAVADKLRRALEAPFWLEGAPVEVGASVGLAVFPSDGQAASALLQQADAAMYRDKRGPRGATRRPGRRAA